MHLASVLDVKAPVVLASSWMAGASAIVARMAAAQLDAVDEIETAVLYSLKDKAGPNSVEYADRMAIPFRVITDGGWTTAKAMSDPADIHFPGGYRGKAYRFDEPSQETLALYTGARTVSSRITYDDPRTTGTMAFLVNSGIWRLISGPAFAQTRRSMLYSPGEGVPHEIVVSVVGRSANGHRQRIRSTIVDPAGQTHLTAVGAYIQLRLTLGLGNRAPRAAGIYLPENTDAFDDIRAIYDRHGVELAMVTLPAG